nr:ribonuclease H-like domain-containing protein [Tanacetum cinerariifolium]
MIATPEEPDLPGPVPETFHEQTDEKLTENDIKWIDADDQAIQTILLGLPEDVYAVVDSCETAKEIWERVRQMMKGLDIEEQEKKAKLFNEWKKITSTDGELIKSYYHRFMVEHLAKTHDTLELMAHSQNSYKFPSTHNDQSSSIIHSQQSFPINNKYNLQPSLNQNFMQPPMTSLKDINDPTEAMNATLILFAKAFQLTTPTNNNQRTSSNPRNRQIAQPGMNMSQDRQSQNIGGNSGNHFGQYAGQVAHNQQGYNAWQNGIANQNGTGNIVAARAEGTGSGNQVRLSCLLLKRKKHGFNFKQKNLTLWLLQLDKAPVYDTDGSAEVQLNDNYYDNDIFNMFTQEEQYTNLLEPIPEPQLVPQNDNHVTSVAPSLVQSQSTVEKFCS